MGVFCFREAKCILRWSLLTCFKTTFVHLVGGEESELAFLVSPLLQVKVGGARRVYSTQKHGAPGGLS